MNLKKRTWIFALLATIMLTVPMVPASPQQAREDYTVRHVSTFSDGKAERTVSFGASGTDKSVSIALPNGARVLSATMNITSLPGADAGSDYVENLTLDVGNDGALEYAFKGTGYGRMGYQRLFSTGASILNVSLPVNGGTNATPSVRLPKNATVTSATLSVGSGGGIGGAGKLLILAADSTMAYIQDVQTKLKSFPDVTQVDYIQINSQTPSLDTLTLVGVWCSRCSHLEDLRWRRAGDSNPATIWCFHIVDTNTPPAPSGPIRRIIR
jgi:hypothetical protein